MAILYRDTRAALIARVAQGLTTQDDAKVLDRLLPPSGRISVPLADEQVVEMRQLWAHWRITGVLHRTGLAGRGYGTIAACFGCASSTARDIVRGRTRRAAGGPIDEQ